MQRLQRQEMRGVFLTPKEIDEVLPDPKDAVFYAVVSEAKKQGLMLSALLRYLMFVTACAAEIRQCGWICAAETCSTEVHAGLCGKLSCCLDA